MNVVASGFAVTEPAIIPSLDRAEERRDLTFEGLTSSEAFFLPEPGGRAGPAFLSRRGSLVRRVAQKFRRHLFQQPKMRCSNFPHFSQ